MRDGYLPQILGLMAAGLTSTALALPGYLHQQETATIGTVQLQYPAPIRKIPLSVLGAGFCISAWCLSQDRREYRRQYERWQEHQARLQEVAEAAQLEAHVQLAQFKAAEQVYPAIGHYLDVPAETVPSQPVQPVAQNPVSPAVHQPAPVEPPADPTAYLANFLEYPGLLFGGMGAGKSWTARYIAARKVAAGHRVVVLDPHAATREWKGVQHIGAGMNYDAIAQFLTWYLAEIHRRYQDFDRSDLGEEDWQEQQRQRGQVVSVICEEMTNWADRLPSGLAGEFFKAAMSDSRKVLMPPLFVAHDRTLSCLGDAKGMARLRDAALIELELIATVHPTTRKPVSSGTGRLKLPGHQQWADVELPRIERKITDFTGYQSGPVTHIPPISRPEPPVSPVSTPRKGEMSTRNRLETLLSLDCELPEDSPEMISEKPEIDHDRQRRVLEMKRNKLSQTLILWIEWQVRPGDSQKYRDALEEYRRLTSE